MPAARRQQQQLRPQHQRKRQSLQVLVRPARRPLLVLLQRPLRLAVALEFLARQTLLRFSACATCRPRRSQNTSPLLVKSIASVSCSVGTCLLRLSYVVVFLCEFAFPGRTLPTPLLTLLAVMLCSLVPLVKFVDVSSVAKALALNGSTLGERAIRVEPARARAPRKKRAPRRKDAAAPAAGGSGAPRAAPAAKRAPINEADARLTIWAGGLPEGATEEAVSAALAKFGKVTKVFLGRERP